MTPRLLKEAKQYWRVRQEWLGEGGIPSPHAQQRANVCLTCPHHDDQHPLEEAGKRLAVRMTLDLKRANNWHVQGDLHLCGLCWCLLETKVHVPLHIARANTPDWVHFTKHCWLHDDTLT